MNNEIIVSFMFDHVVGGIAASGIPLMIYYLIVRKKYSVFKLAWVRYGIAGLIVFWGARFSYSFFPTPHSYPLLALGVGSAIFTATVYTLSTFYYILFKRERYSSNVQITTEDVR